MSPGPVPFRSVPDSPDNSDSPGPYERLGVSPDAAFDDVQAAREARLAEEPDDPMARSRIEAAYDAILMDRLKERQQGRVSTAARSASQREKLVTPASQPILPPLPQLPSLPAGRGGVPALSLPSFALASGREFWLPLVAIGALSVLMLLPGAEPRLLLGLATAVTLLNLQRRLGRFPAAVGWSLGLLVGGVLLGGAVVALLGPQVLALPLGPLQLESLPALLLLLLGSLLLA